MNLLPKASGTRPRVACDISAQGVVAARSSAPGAPLAAVARVELASGAVLPGLKPGNVVDRVAVAAAVRSVLESVGMKSGSREANVALVIPDGAVRVLLLEFDSLPTKLSEALPIVRFRLKKLLPFEADDAMVTYQVMSTSKTIVRVLAVAIPRDVLSEYETAVREAGYEPGAVLPSTLAALAGVDDESPVLVVNANVYGVTAAIVRSGILMLHRSVDLQAVPMGTPANLPPALFDTPNTASPLMTMPLTLPLVSVEDTEGEWAAQEALPEHGRNPYADRALDEAATQDGYGVTGMRVPGVYMPEAHGADGHGSVLVAQTTLADLIEADVAAEVAAAALHQEPGFSNRQTFELGEEIAQAVSVAAAYFEDTLAIAPEQILSAGPLGAAFLGQILTEHGLLQADRLRVRELVETTAVQTDAVSASVPRAWLAGVAGALQG